MDEENDRFVTLGESPELRAFAGIEPETDEIRLFEIWRTGLLLTGRPPAGLVLVAHLHGLPDEYPVIRIGFDLQQARDIHQALGELLDQMP